MYTFLKIELNVPYQSLGLSTFLQCSYIFFYYSFQCQLSYICNYVFFRNTTHFLFFLFLFPSFIPIFSIYLHVCIFSLIQFSCRLIILLIFIFLLLLLNFDLYNDTLLLYIIFLFPFVVLSLILLYIFWTLFLTT